MSVGAATETRAAPRARARGTAGFVNRQTKRTVGWSGALFVVIVCSLIPVLWIVMLSLKTPASATDGSFIPHHWTLSELQGHLQHRDLHRRAAQLDRDRVDLDCAGGDPRLLGRVRDRPA